VYTGLNEPDERVARFYRFVTLERGLVAGAVAILAGLIMLVVAILKWKAVGFGHLDYDQSLRWVVPGATLVAAGLQTVLSSFFLTILDNPRR